MRWALLLLVAPGCFGMVPFLNEAPKLKAVNGISPEYGSSYFELPPVEEGTDVQLDFEIVEPEHDRVRVWFPYAVGVVDFDPDGTSGVWHVPEGRFPGMELRVVLEDDRDPPQRGSFSLAFYSDSSYGSYGYYDDDSASDTAEFGFH